MVALGLGKNMVKSARFWVQAAGMATFQKGGPFRVTDLGNSILSHDGYDPFLEDIRTLWLIHWHLSTHVEEPLFAWDYLLNRWPHPELSKSTALLAFRYESNRIPRERELSDVTLEQHFEAFLHSYVPTRSRKGRIQEDNLDCPLVELRLLEPVGEKRSDSSGKYETVYAFRREPKPEISAELFLYGIEDYWAKYASKEQTLSFRAVAHSAGGPGQVFKLSEEDVRERLERVHSESGGVYSYRESASTQHLSRTKTLGGKRLLAMMYRKAKG